MRTRWTWLLVAFLAALLAASARAEELPEAAPVDVALDPGHSRVDVGAVGAGLAEYQVTLDLALRVRTLLEAEGVTVRLIRVDDEPLSAMDHPDPIERVRIEQEARLARAAGARVYLSIHLNAFRSPSLRGTETYYNPDNHGPESWRLAEAVQRHVVAALGAAGYEPVDRGVKSDLLAGKPYGHFFGLRGDLPSALVETLFLSNPLEARWAGREEVRQALAAGIAAGLLEYLRAAPERAAGSERRPAALDLRSLASASDPHLRSGRSGRPATW